MSEVHLDSLDGQEQALGDLGVGGSPGGHLSDPQFAGRQRVCSRGNLLADTNAACTQLGPGRLGQRVRPAGVGQLVPVSQWLTTVDALAAPAQDTPKRDQRAGQLETCG
jgi:hypothetical protein